MRRSAYEEVDLSRTSIHIHSWDSLGRGISAPPGALNPAVTQATIATTICVHGWTATVRPPASYTNKLKKQQIAHRGYQDKNPAHYEEDHWIPLALGGHPRDPHNLWPQPLAEAKKKDQVEDTLHRATCKGTVTLKQAQDTIHHWQSR